MKIRKQVSNILKFTITSDQEWGKIFKVLETEGRINLKQIVEILVILLEREEKREENEE